MENDSELTKRNGPTTPYTEKWRQARLGVDGVIRSPYYEVDEPWGDTGDKKLDRLFADSQKWERVESDEDGRPTLTEQVIWHPRYPLCRAVRTWELVQKPEEGADPIEIGLFTATREIIDDGATPVKGIQEIAKYSMLWPRQPKRGHRGGAPKGMRDETADRYSAIANMYYRGHLTQAELARELRVSIRTVQRALSEYPRLAMSNARK